MTAAVKTKIARKVAGVRAAPRAIQQKVRRRLQTKEEQQLNLQEKETAQRAAITAQSTDKNDENTKGILIAKARLQSSKARDEFEQKRAKGRSNTPTGNKWAQDYINRIEDLKKGKEIEELSTEEKVDKIKTELQVYIDTIKKLTPPTKEDSPKTGQEEATEEQPVGGIYNVGKPGQARARPGRAGGVFGGGEKRRKRKKGKTFKKRRKSSKRRRKSKRKKRRTKRC